MRSVFLIIKFLGIWNFVSGTFDYIWWLKFSSRNEPLWN